MCLFHARVQYSSFRQDSDKMMDGVVKSRDIVNSRCPYINSKALRIIPF